MSAELLELAADILGPLADEMVFVGGATIHLWIREETAPAVRATDDVDVICDITSYAEYQGLSERLRAQGLQEAMNEPVICRWRDAESGLAIDVMPIAEDVLGFSNPWYRVGIETAIERTLPSGTTIRAVTPPVVVATKLAAWKGRGNDDILRSLDVHDIIVLVNGRSELIDELAAQNEQLKRYVAKELADLEDHAYFDYVIQDAVKTYGTAAGSRADIIRGRINDIVDRLQT
jgi:predicted nucleotidyltransferase